MHFDKNMLNITQMEKGEKIYHYTTIDTLISITSGKEFWVTKWDYLNDIDEFRVAEDVCEAVLREENVNEKTIKEIKQSIAEERLFELYLCSFSCDGDNQLLWSNYSDCDGVNLEIDCLKLEENLEHNILWHGLVPYDFELQKKLMRESFYDQLVENKDFGNIKALNEINGLQGNEYEKLISHISVICELYSMFFKRSCFKGESEYRFVFSIDENQEISFRSKNGIVLPFIRKKVKTLDFITRVTIGPTNRIDIAEKGVKELLHYYKRDVNIVKSQIPLRFK